MSDKSHPYLTDTVTLSKILERFYSVPMGTMSWQEALASYGELFPAVYMALVGYEGRLADTSVLAHANFEESFIRSYSEYYYTLNPWTDLLMRAPQAPDFVWGHDFVPIKDIQRTEFYADWVEPQGDISTGFASCLHREHDRFFLFSANVSPLHLEQAERAAEAFKIIGPHMQRALELWRRLEGQSLAHSALLEILDRLSSAVFVVDGGCRLLFENRQARELARKARVVAIAADGALKFIPHHNQVAVEKHFAAVRRLMAAEPEPMLLRLGSTGPASAALFVAPLARSPPVDAAEPGERCYLVFIIDLMKEPLVKTDMLSRALGITRAEAMLARALYEDKTLSGYADERGLSKHTARAQLKSLMQKTETTRQTELMKLLTQILSFVELKGGS